MSILNEFNVFLDKESIDLLNDMLYDITYLFNKTKEIYHKLVDFEKNSNDKIYENNLTVNDLYKRLL